MMMWQQHGLHTTFAAHGGVADTLLLATMILALQCVFLMLGLLALKRQNHAAAYLRGEGNSLGAYALVRAGVAFSVMRHFWVNKGLAGTGLIAKFRIAYWALWALAGERPQRWHRHHAQCRCAVRPGSSSSERARRAPR